MHEEIMTILNSWNACYHAIQNEMLTYINAIYITMGE
jgi:hypothetical protein